MVKKSQKNMSVNKPTKNLLDLVKQRKTDVVTTKKGDVRKYARIKNSTESSDGYNFYNN